MLTATAAYRAALPKLHKRATVIRVFHGGVDVTPESGIPLSAGIVRASLNSRVTRTADLVLPSTFYPVNDTDLLSPTRAVLKIFTGIEYGDGSQEIFPVFTGRVSTPTRERDGRLRLRCDDLAADVVAQRFDIPGSSIAGASTVGEIRRFIAQVLPTAPFVDGDVVDQPVPALTWDDDRGRALDELAASVQGRWYALGDGSFTVRRYPYAGQTPVGRIADGEDDGNGGGLISGADISRSREGVANSVTVISERIDGSPPVYVTVRDTEPGSPTLYGDLYGRVSAVLRPQTPLTQAAAEALARRVLASTTALTQQWSVTMVPDATLEPGDALTMLYDDILSVQVIDSISYPLTTQGVMDLQCRSVSDVEGTIV